MPHTQSTALMSLNKTTSKAMISQTVVASSAGGDEGIEQMPLSEQKSIKAINRRSLIMSSTQKGLKQSVRIKRLSRAKNDT